MGVLVVDTRPAAKLHEALPVDVLLQIFYLATTADPNIPLVLSSVDRQLRELTLSTPLLWSRINFVPSWGPPKTHLFLSRSGTVPLKVSIDYDEKLAYGKIGRTTSLLTALDPHRHRLRSFRACFADSLQLRSTLIWIMSRPLPELNHLTVGYRNLLFHVDEDIIPELRPDAFPAIQTLRIHSLPLPKWVLLPNQRMTQMHLEGPLVIMPAELRNVLLALPNLDSLCLRDIGTWLLLPEGGVPPVEPVELPVLKKLEVLRLPCWFVESLAEFLKAPALNWLSLTAGLGWDRHSKVINAILLNDYKLESLDICSFTLEVDDWKNLFQRMRYLRSLRIASCELLDECLVHLASWRCPNLSSLTIDNELYVSLAVVRMVLFTRLRNGGRALQSLCIRGIPEENAAEEDIDALRELLPNFSLGDYHLHDYVRRADLPETEDEDDTVSEEDDHDAAMEVEQQEAGPEAGLEAEQEASEPQDMEADHQDNADEDGEESDPDSSSDWSVLEEGMSDEDSELGSSEWWSDGSGSDGA